MAASSLPYREETAKGINAALAKVSEIAGNLPDRITAYDLLSADKIAEALERAKDLEIEAARLRVLIAASGLYAR